MSMEPFSFTKTVLSWSPTHFKANPTRPRTGIAALKKDGPVPSEFANANEYYEFLTEGVLEESWGVVRQGLVQSTSVPFQNIELTQVQFATNVGAPSVLSFRPAGGVWGPTGSLSSFSNTVVELDWDGWGLGNKGSILGFCGHQAEIRYGLLRIKVVCSVPQLREMSAACAKTPAAGWKVRSLGVSLVSQQRMCEALAAAPQVAFMPSLLMGKGGAALDGNNPFLSMSSDVMASTTVSRTKSSALDALNAGQAGAMGAFLAAGTGELHCVVGPPGTGKTLAISALVKALVADGKRVLVSAPSNKAVQVLAERFKHDVENDAKVNINISMLAADDKLESTRYLRECYTNTWGEANCDKIQVVVNAVTPVADKTAELSSDAHATLQAAQADLLSIQKDIRRHAPTHDNKNNISKTMKTAADHIGKVLAVLQPETVKRKTSAPIQAPKKPVGKKETKKEKKALKKRGTKNNSNSEAIASESIPDMEPETPDPSADDASVLSASTDGLTEMATVTETSVDAELVYANLESALEHLAQVQAVLREGYDELELLNHAHVIFGTLAVLGRTQIRAGMRPVDVLVIDEAAQSTEAETCIAFLYKPQKCLLVGDTKQLPATVISREAERLGYGRSLMSRLIDQCRYAHATLTIQYRMHPEIRHWPSLRFYNNRLRDDKSVTGNHRTAPWHVEPFLGPYTVIDCEDGMEQRKGMSFTNEQEAHTCMAVLRHLYARYGVDVAKRAVVVTFYAGQVEILRQIMGDTFWGENVNIQLRIHTVDSFQGSEADIVVLSMVRANQREAQGFIRDYRRLNVALTRAKQSLIVVGHANTLSCVPNSDLEALVKDARSRDLCMTSSQVLKAIKGWRKGKGGVPKGAPVSEQVVPGSEAASANGDGTEEPEVDDWEQLLDD